MHKTTDIEQQHKEQQ